MTDQMTQDVDNFERQMTRDEEVALARRILAFVPDDYTDDQLADIGKRARHWVLKAVRRYRGGIDPLANQMPLAL